jgi:hypothetical protein
MKLACRSLLLAAGIASAASLDARQTNNTVSFQTTPLASISLKVTPSMFMNIECFEYLAVLAVLFLFACDLALPVLRFPNSNQPSRH